MNYDLTVINLFGPPGIGKSALAGYLFGAMKRKHMSVGQVVEYAKDLLHRLPPIPKEDIAGVLAKHQMKIFAEQYYRQEIFDGVYTFAVTDSPLLLSRFYAPKPYFGVFPDMVSEVFQAFNNINFYLTRDMSATPFEDEGRAHSKSESAALDLELRGMLAEMSIPFTEIDLDQPYPELEIIRHLQDQGWATVNHDVAA